MTSAQQNESGGWFSGRTRIITLVSISTVALAGAFAVSANIGILDSASNSAVGNAAAVGDLTPASTPVVDGVLPGEDLPSLASTTGPPPASAAPNASRQTERLVQEFAVDSAGTVAIASIGDGIGLERVAPAPGWSWKLSQTDSSRLLVTMTSGSRTLEFSAERATDGRLRAQVAEPVVAAAPSVPDRAREDLDHEDGDHEDDDHEDGDHEDGDHEDDDGRGHEDDDGRGHEDGHEGREDDD